MEIISMLYVQFSKYYSKWLVGYFIFFVAILIPPPNQAQAQTKNEVQTIVIPDTEGVPIRKPKENSVSSQDPKL